MMKASAESPLSPSCTTVGTPDTDLPPQSCSSSQRAEGGGRVEREGEKTSNLENLRRRGVSSSREEKERMKNLFSFPAFPHCWKHEEAPWQRTHSA